MFSKYYDLDWIFGRCESDISGKTTFAYLEWPIWHKGCDENVEKIEGKKRIIIEVLNWKKKFESEFNRGK